MLTILFKNFFQLCYKKKAYFHIILIYFYKFKHFFDIENPFIDHYKKKNKKKVSLKRPLKTFQSQ